MPDDDGSSPGKQVLLFSLPWDLHHIGGVTQVVSNLLARTAAAPALDPVLLVVNTSAPAGQPEEQDGIRILHQDIHSPWNPDRPLRHLITLPFRWPVSLLRTIRMLREVRPAAVNVHYVSLWVLTLRFAMRFVQPRPRLVLSFHGTDMREFERGGAITRWLWKRLLDRVDGITCCSGSLRQRLLDQFPRCRTDVSVIYNAVEQEDMVASRTVSAPVELMGRRFIINVARFEEKKGQDLLVTAWSRICGRFPGVQLVLLGPEGPTFGQVSELIHLLRIGDRVTIIPGVPHPEALAAIRCAELFVLSSRREPFGIVLLEAAMLGVPIVAANVDGVPEVLENGRLGLLVEGDNADALAAGIERMLSDQALRDGYRQVAQQAAQTFTWQAAFARYADLMLRHRG